MSQESSRTQQSNRDDDRSRSLWLETVDVVAVHVIGLLLVSLLFRIATTDQDFSNGLLLTLAILPGYLFADFASGLVHWFCDTFFEEETPLLGKLLIQPFREHHRDPEAMTRHGFFELNGNNCLAMIPLLFIAWWIEGPIAGSAISQFAYSFLFTVALTIFATNQFHQWAHAQEPPAVARWLQRSGIILRPERHERHHRDFSREFCMTSGWMNLLLDALQFFPRITFVVRFLQR